MRITKRLFLSPLFLFETSAQRSVVILSEAKDLAIRDASVAALSQNDMSVDIVRPLSLEH